MALLARRHVREYWLVDLRTQTVTIVDFASNLPEMRVAKGIEAIRSSVLPGLTATGFCVFAP